MGTTEPIVAELAGYAPKYQAEIFDSVADELNVNRNGLLEAEPRKGLEFFYRLYGFNRDAAMNAGYQYRAVEALRKTETDDVIDPQTLWEQFETECTRNNIGPYENRNRNLLVETAQFANRKGNPFSWVARELENGVQLRSLASEVRSLHGIGPGKARFFLRDAVWLCEADVTGRNRRELQPMTGPIQKAASTLWPHLESKEEMANRIVEACENAGVSEIEFNQGTWYFQNRVPRDLKELRGSLQ